MKNEDINYYRLNRHLSMKKKENKIFARRISQSFHIKRNFQSLMLNKKGEQKSLKHIINRKSSESFPQINEDIEFNKKDKSKNKIIVNDNLNKFYNIRKQILERIKKPYLNPYIENKNNFTQNNINNINTTYNLSSSEKITIYDYYQIDNLLNKNIKNKKLLSRLNEYLLSCDNQEYFMKYFDNDEQRIIMNYLLYQVYGKDILVKLPKNSAIKVSDINIIDSFKNIKKYIYNDFFQILDLKPVLTSKIKYIFIFDIPKHLIPNCIPNLFPHLLFHSFYLKLYLNIRMNKLSKNIESLVGDENKEEEIISSKNYNIKDKNKNIFEEIKENTKENIEENNKDDIANISNKKIDNNNKEDNRDIERFLYKINKLIQSKKSKEEKLLQQKSEEINYKQNKYLNDFLNKSKEYNTLKKEDNNNSLIENKNNIKLYNKRFFIKTAKKTKSIFKTSLNRTNYISKNTSQKSTIYNQNSIIEDRNNKINSGKINIKKNLTKKNSKKLKTTYIHYFGNKKFIKKNILQINKSQIYNLQGFEKIYKEFKEKGILPKPKKKYKTYIHKSFDSLPGFDYFAYVENKLYNNKIEYEENKILNDYNSKKLEKSIKQMFNRYKLFPINNLYLKKMVNSSNIYGN